MSGKFEIYEDRAGKWRFRLKRGNGQVIAVGEAYQTEKAALRACGDVQEAAAGARAERVAS